MTLKELIQALEKISKENPELEERTVFCQVDFEITSIDKLTTTFEVKQNEYISEYVNEDKLTEEDKSKNPKKVLLLS